MASVIGFVALIAILVWFLAPARRKPQPAPEDDIATPIDRAELEDAERELAEDPGPRQFGEPEEDDDWGPGASRGR